MLDFGRFYSAEGIRERGVVMSICLSLCVCVHSSKRLHYTEFLGALLVVVARSFSDAITINYLLPTVILIVILIIIGIPSPTHSFTLGLNPSFSANPPYPNLSFFSFRFHYMDFPDCLLLSKSVFLLFSFSIFTLF